jgi:hypothetical protein
MIKLETIYRLQKRGRWNKRWCYWPFYFATMKEAERYIAHYRVEYPGSTMKWRIREGRGFVTHAYPPTHPKRIKP